MDVNSILTNGEITSFIEGVVDNAAFGIWFLIGAALVFFMQAGFAMVESGFTRAKNAGNIIMKNLMDFCIGTVVFVLLGFSLMMAEDYVFGFIGIPNLSIFTNFAPKLLTCSSTTGRVSNASTRAPRRFAVAIACKPATPTPITNTLSGEIVPAGVIIIGIILFMVVAAFNTL